MLAIMIKFDAVTKYHGSQRGGRRAGKPAALSNVTFEVPAGQLTAFVGPNGAGKSSAMRILLGLDYPTSGQALINGQRYRDLPRPMHTVGALLDGAGAHRSRTARAHLLWVAQAAGIPQHRVDEVLEQVGLPDAANKKIGKFSLGMGQRLGIATALLGSPEILVLDEPTNGLDPDGIRWLRRLLRSHVDAGGTVLLSSHQLAEVAMIADNLVVINQGRIVATGTPHTLVQGYRNLEEAYFAFTNNDENPSITISDDNYAVGAVR